VFCRVFIAEDVDGVGDKGSGAQQRLTYRNSRGVFLNVPEINYFIDKVSFSGRKQNFQSWDYFPQVPDDQDFRVIGRRIK